MSAAVFFNQHTFVVEIAKDGGVHFLQLKRSSRLRPKIPADSSDPSELYVAFYRGARDVTLRATPPGSVFRCVHEGERIGGARAYGKTSDLAATCGANSFLHLRFVHTATLRRGTGQALSARFRGGGGCASRLKYTRRCPRNAVRRSSNRCMGCSSRSTSMWNGLAARSQTSCSPREHATACRLAQILRQTESGPLCQLCGRLDSVISGTLR